MSIIPLPSAAVLAVALGAGVSSAHAQRVSLEDLEAAVQAAQATADQAVSDAAAAQSTATQAGGDAAAAQTTATQAAGDAAAAQSTATQAASDAAAAQTSAGTALTRSNNALTAASNASTAAATAQTTANTAVTNAAAAAQTTASNAATAAAAAQTAADDNAADIALNADDIVSMQEAICTLFTALGASPVPDFCPRIVFLSSTTSNGNLGGLAGADARCQSLADTAGLPGTYMAWLSTAGGSPSTRFTQSPTPYVRTDGVQVAADWADLTDGALGAPLNVNELGAAVTGTTVLVWTGTVAGGTQSGGNCTAWASSGGTSFGLIGNAALTTANWSSIGSNTACSNTARLYCIQQ